MLLNEMFKTVTKLNAGVENLGKSSEIYKLKLLNAELREKVTRL